MSVGKVLKSVSYGVSKQPFELRIEGQHEEQINMLSDPVVGITRRWGTEQLDRHVVPLVADITSDLGKRLAEYLSTWGEVEYRVHNRVYRVMYPTTARPEGLPSDFWGNSCLAIRMDGPDGPELSPIHYHHLVATQIAKGFSCACQVGAYLVFYPANTVTEQSVQVDHHGMADNARLATISVGVGLYDRDYTLQVNIDGVNYQGTFHTPSSSYPGSFGTTDLFYEDPDYKRKLDKLTNDFNQETTKWIRYAGFETLPETILFRLYERIRDAIPSSVGATFGIIGTTLWMNIPGLWSVNAWDGENGKAIKVVHQVIKEAAEVTPVHFHGKVIAVKPFKDSPSYYLMAHGNSTLSGPQIVTWKECAIWQANKFGDLTDFPFVLMYAARDGRPLVCSGSPEELKTTVGGSEVELKGLGVRQAGDGESNPPPYWYGKEVHYMGVFQDRLLVASGSTICASEAGDYFNWYRKTVLTVLDSDPVEMVAANTEGDFVRRGVPFDESLLLFGDKYQYLIHGEQPLTPTTANISISSSVEGTTSANPRPSGDFVFFAKKGEVTSSLYQVEVAGNKDTRVNTNIGLQVKDYINGSIVEIEAMLDPDMVFVRTDKEPYKVYVFRYIQQEKKRLLESWSSFDYGERFGRIIGMSTYRGILYLVTYRVMEGDAGAKAYICLEKQSIQTGTSDMPYLDSMRPFSEFYTSGETGRDLWNQGYASLGLSKGSSVASNWLCGVSPAPSTPEALEAFYEGYPSATQETMFVGMEYPSYVTLSPPVSRDYRDLPQMDGRYSIRGVKIGYKDTSGMYVQVKTKYNLKSDSVPFSWSIKTLPVDTTEVLTDRNETLGTYTSQIGVTPVTSGSIWAKIGRRNTDYLATIYARTWMPLTITSITYRGQWYSPTGG